MILIAGELRKIIDAQYKSQTTGQLQPQKILVIEPHEGRQNYEVYLTPNQLKNNEILRAWHDLKSKPVNVAVRLYVNYQHAFYKYIAIGDGLPQEKLK